MFGTGMSHSLNTLCAPADSNIEEIFRGPE